MLDKFETQRKALEIALECLEKKCLEKKCLEKKCLENNSKQTT